MLANYRRNAILVKLNFNMKVNHPEVEFCVSVLPSAVLTTNMNNLTHDTEFPPFPQF